MAAIKLRQQGQVVIRVSIDNTGAVTMASVFSSSSYSSLDDAALAAARQTRFRPHQKNSQAVQALADIPYEFSLAR